MKYVIIWNYLDANGLMYLNQEISFDDRDEANKAWKEMKQDGRFMDMRHETRSETKMYFAVRVRFCRGGKVYTYLSKTAVNAGEDVVVLTESGREILTVEWSGKMTKTQLEQICPFSNFKYIYGRVVRDC